jgi:hypothetical protein
MRLIGMRYVRTRSLPDVPLQPAEDVNVDAIYLGEAPAIDPLQAIEEAA